VARHPGFIPGISANVHSEPPVALCHYGRGGEDAAIPEAIDTYCRPLWV